MWTSSNLPPVLKGEWYRYFLFTEGAERKVGYIQSSKTLEELKFKFKKWYVNDRFGIQDTGKNVDIVTGRYDVFRGGRVRVMVSQSWADIFFELEISRIPAKNLHLSLMRHYACLGNESVVQYDTPSQTEYHDESEGSFHFHEDLSF